jgi:hypothetical protein
MTMKNGTQEGEYNLQYLRVLLIKGNVPTKSKGGSGYKIKMVEEG